MVCKAICALGARGAESGVEPVAGEPSYGGAGSVGCGRPANMGDRMIVALVIAAVVFAAATFPATWLLMLFLGNLGIELSYVATLPMGILVSALLAGASATTSR